MPDQKVSEQTEDTVADGTENILVITGGTGKRMLLSTALGYYNQIRVPTYVSGNWYNSWPSQSITTSSALSANTTYLTPFRILQSVTISQLGGRVIAAGTNIQFGIYASNNATGRPTGACLAKIASQAAGANTNIAAAISGGNVTLTPGIYWYGVAVDNAATTVQGAASGTTNMSSLFGSATQANVIQNTLYGVSFSNTFGTWSSATAPGGGFTELTSNLVAVPCFKIA